MVKKCNKCLEIKPVSGFSKEARAKNGYKPRCKKCTAEYMKMWLDKNPRYVNNQMKASYVKHKDRFKKRVNDYSLANRDRKLEYNKEYRAKNLDKINKKSNEYIKQRIDSDPEFRMVRMFRRLIHRLKVEKRGRTAEILGYSMTELVISLGGVPDKNECIDHKIPVSWFKCMEDIKLINSLLNLQILSRSDNAKKSNKFCHPVSIEYYSLIKDKVKDKYINKLKYHAN